MCQCTNVQNHVYASKNRCTYVCDAHQLFNPDHKKYQNLLAALMKKSNQVYYNKYFKTSWSNIKSRWKLIISRKVVAYSVPTVLSLDDGDTTTSSYDTANTFNNYFASVAETMKQRIKYSHKHFSDYLGNQNGSTIFLQPTSIEEIAKIISSLNSNKASNPNSIPYRILFLLKNEILKQLTDLFNLFHECCFFIGTQTCKGNSCFKERFKLYCSNYCPIPLLSNK